MDKKWVALFSQTGTELVNIISALRKTPDIIFTNAKDESRINPRIVLGVPRPLYGTHDEIMKFLRETDEQYFITLHGYLRLIPTDVCERHEIYNGHPGLITKFPELKGKDPQEKVWSNHTKYGIIGSVVHRVIPEVDSGEIVAVSEATWDDKNSSIQLYDTLRKTSLDSWIDFLTKRL